jgi:hyperosmotically inducible periplasmic protein
MKTSLYAAVIACLLLAGHVPAMRAQDSTSQADNTRNNKGDQPTADQQKENTTDRQITQRIRSAVVKDKDLSTYAHNIKIITQNGEVTLKGPVRTEQEKESIESKAAEVAGSGHVTDQLEIAPKQ